MNRTRLGCWKIGFAIAVGIALVGSRTARAESIPFGSELAASLAGWVYCDINNDAFRDAKEIGLSGVQITLEGLTSEGETVHAVQETLENGAFLFKNLAPGKYSLLEIQTERYVQGKPNPVGSGATDAGEVVDSDRFKDIVLSEGDVATDYNFGEWGLKAKYITKKPFLVVVPEPACLWIGLPLLGWFFLRRRASRRP